MLVLRDLAERQNLRPLREINALHFFNIYDTKEIVQWKYQSWLIFWWHGKNLFHNGREYFYHVWNFVQKGHENFTDNVRK